MKISHFLLPLFAVAALLTGCGSSSSGSLQPADPPDDPPLLPDSALLILSSQLVGENPVFMLSSVEASNPGSISASATITGLADDDTLVGMDFRPANGDLYAVGRLGNLYVINPQTAVVEATIPLVPAPDTMPVFEALDGMHFGVDFNPVPDRLRVTSDTGQNLRINVDNGETIVDGDIAYAEESDVGGIEDIPLLGPLLGVIGSILLPEDDAAVPALTAAAYTNSFAGTTTTQLFTLDIGNDSLNLQNPPNDGTQVPLTDTPVAISGDQGFDIIGGDNGLVLAALSSNGMGPYTLYSINLMTGAFTDRGQIGGADGPALRGITLQLR